MGHHLPAADHHPAEDRTPAADHHPAADRNPAARRLLEEGPNPAVRHPAVHSLLRCECLPRSSRPS